MLHRFALIGLVVAVVAAVAAATAVGGGRAAASSDTDFTVAPDEPLVTDFGGFGAQFNQHLYAAISGPPANIAQLEQLVTVVRAPFVRVFFNTGALTDEDKLTSFYRTVELARRSEAELNITWQGSSPAFAVANAPRFAAIIAKALEARRGSWVWVTMFNEPNSTRITLAQYEDVYRHLDAELRALGIRDRVRFMGGDLLGSTSPLGQTQAEWFRFLASDMGDLLEAWSVHIYWDFWDTAKIDRRLVDDVLKTTATIPLSERRPLYVTEFGVRGVATFEGESNFQPGQWPDGTLMTLTTTAAFQHAWFMLRAAQLGYTATAKWDMYSAKYDVGLQDHSAIGLEAGRWTPRPVYELLRFLTWTTEPRHGRTVAVHGGESRDATRLVTAYRSPGNNLTVLGLDRRGGLVATVDESRVAYTIRGLPVHSLFRLLLWNADGDSEVKEIGYLDTGADGVVTFAVPVRAVFALTDTPLPMPPW